MAGEIKKMARMRKRILKGVLYGWGILHGLYIFCVLCMIIATESRSLRQYQTSFLYTILEEPKTLYRIVVISAILVFLFSITKYFMYKRKLMRNSLLRFAVDDERVKQNWLIAYRFAFFVVIIFEFIYLLLFYLFREGILITFLSNHLVFYLAIMTCIGTFLYYNRGEQDEQSNP
jgi:hypothetical protein